MKRFKSGLVIQDDCQDYLNALEIPAKFFQSCANITYTAQVVENSDILYFFTPTILACQLVVANRLILSVSVSQVQRGGTFRSGLVIQDDCRLETI